jgi:aerobic carbon-monoxide dehydrogenase medium subunit
MPFEVHQPDSVAEAVRLAGTLPSDARFLAGGTDLIIQINRKRTNPLHLIALDRIDALHGIEIGNRHIRVGALTTHKMIERHPAFAGPGAALAEAARVVGGHQIRNVGTIGGNIVNASPAADLLPALLALNADVVLAGSEGSRQVPLSRFLKGPGITDRADDELLVQVLIDRPSPTVATTFLKAGRRRAMEISVVCVAALLERDEAGNCRTVRIALGAVGPVASRAVEAEEILQGQPPTEAALREAGRRAASACTPISDVRASADYRRMLVEALVPRALKSCLQRIEERAA